MASRTGPWLLLCAALFLEGACAQDEAAPPPPPPPPPAPAAEPMPQGQVLRELRDFGGLGVYAAENAALPEAPVDRVVFLGDSITRTWTTASSFFPGKPYLNRGVDGQTTAQMLLRFRQDVIDLKPAVVVIQGGLADIAGFTGPSSLAEIEGNLRSMAELAMHHHIRPVLVGAPPPADFPGRTGPEPVTLIVALNERVKAWCAAAGLLYLDYYSALVGADGQMKAGVSDDGVHPNAAGYALLSPLAEEAIAAALKQRAGDGAGAPPSQEP